MGLWVRSQDRKELTQRSTFVLNKLYPHKGTKGLYSEIHDGAKNFNEVYSISGLGIYTTKEKAFIVLDMIQMYIANTPSYINACGGDEWATYGKEPFQMPLDEEVENYAK